MPVPAEGQGEILLIDGHEKERQALRGLLEKMGFTPTALPEPSAATELATTKFFPMALIDLDTPKPGGGIQVLLDLRRASPTSAVLALAPRATFRLAVDAFRAGALDVIPKSPDGIVHMQQKLYEIARLRGSATHDPLLVEMQDLGEKLLERLLEASRRLWEIEERTSMSPTSISDSVCKVLYVDTNDKAYADLEAALSDQAGIALIGVNSGGAALDYAGSENYPLILVKESLPDLPGPFVAHSLQDLSPGSTIGLFEVSQDHGGRLRLLAQENEPPTTFASPRELATKLLELRDTHLLGMRERRYLRAFRERHLDLLRRHADVKRKLELLRSAKRTD